MAAATTMTTTRRHFALAAVLALAVFCCCLPAAAAGKQYRVGGEAGWCVPPPEGKDKYYDNWAANITFYVDDSLGTYSRPHAQITHRSSKHPPLIKSLVFRSAGLAEFVYKNDSVLRVSKAGYYHCNETAGDAAPRDGRTVFRLDAPGDAYFASADLQRCGMGERLAVSVLAAAAAQPPAPSPTSWSSSAPGPWSWVLSPAASAPAGDHSAAAPVAVALSCSAHALVLVVVAVALALQMAPGLV